MNLLVIKYRNATWGLFGFRERPECNYVELSVLYKKGLPVTRQRPPVFWDEIYEWYTVLLQSQINAKTDVKFELRFPGVWLS